ncbi:Alpha-1,2-mannosyltransferase ALG9 [Lamellibrachia satsuma]|nr:Alpha-1,2-mannosyltransferase ALG9 [Lamellibrachia satsuma]
MSTKIRSRQPAKKRHQREPEDAEDKPVVSMPWAPTTSTALKALLSARLCAAIWSNISDCDETYNYWEPMHHLMHGYGYQTWEYSPAYAIRSYAYLWLYILPLQLYTNFAQVNRVLQFYFLRCFLSFFCAICEVTLYKAVTRHFGANTGRLMLCLLIFGSGMYVASTAFIPSSFAMYMVTLAVAGWFTNQLSLAVFGIAAAAIVGWPFSAALGVPIAVDYLLRRRQIVPFIKWSLVSATVCLVPMVYVDSTYFDKLVIAPFNIVKYNVFSDHGPDIYVTTGLISMELLTSLHLMLHFFSDHGPDIYGTEPLSFYFVNCFINFNVAFPLALIALPVALLMQYISGQKCQDVPVCLSLAPMYVWMLIFFSQPHKEERFLFPIYPLICLNAAVAIDYLQVHPARCSEALKSVLCSVPALQSQHLPDCYES